MWGTFVGQWGIGEGWANRPNKRLTVGILCFAVALLAGLWVSVETFIEHAHQDRIERLTKENANLARTFEEHAIQTLSYIDENLLLLKRRYEAEGTGFDLNVYWAEMNLNPAIVRNAVITDDTGAAIQGTGTTARLSLADREHIKVHFAADTGNMFIGKTVETRIDGLWSMFLTRRANNPDGSLKGVVSIAVNPFYFSDFYKDIDLGTHGIVAMTGLDGVIRARLGEGPQSIGLDVSKGELYRQVIKSPIGSFSAKAVSDGITRLFSYRTVRDYPLFVSVATSLEEALADVESQAHVYRLLALLVSVGILTVAAYLIESGARLEKMVGERTEALRASEMRLAGIVGLAPEAIIVVDQAGAIRLFNSGAETIFRYDAASAIGQPIDMLLPARYRRRLADMEKSLGASDDSAHPAFKRDRIVGCRRDGSEFPADVSVAKLDLDHERLFIVMLLDMTDTVVQQRALVAAKDEAEAASRAKSEFLANMSHELRTPLNAIIGFSEMMSLQQFGPLGNHRYEGYAHDISSSGRHLLSVINDVLDVAKIEARQMKLDESTLDLEQIALECLGLLKPMADGRGVVVALNVEPRMPRVLADERRIRQIALNLLSNAVKFTPRGGNVTVLIGRDEDGAATLTVADTGIGIPADRLRYIGQPFVRADDHDNRNAEGTGLGLALCNALAALHGGTLTIASEVGCGTTVIVRLPVERVVAETSAA